MSGVEKVLDFVYPEWMSRGACQGLDPTLFFPERGEDVAQAKAVCRACDVRSECLQYALDAGERFGCWGGTSERERRRIRSGRPGPALVGRRPAEHGTRRTMRTCDCPKCVARLARYHEIAAQYAADARARLKVVAP